MSQREVSRGAKTVFEYDVCHLCWHSRVVPWFAAQGAKPQQNEVYW